jgi:hypothetical protein
MNGEEWIATDLEGSRCGPVEVPTLSFHGGIEETTKKSVNITGVPVEILSKHIPKTSLDHYRYTILPGRRCAK